MKNSRKTWIYSLMVIGVSLMLTICTKEDSEKSPEDSEKSPPEIIYGADVSDIDGNVYHTVIIGTQQWMVENLKTTKFNDGTNIPTEADNNTWILLSTPGYCWYNNDISLKNPYGALYNWYAVNTGKLAPDGWHVPSTDEWTKLINYLGGKEVAAAKLKEVGTSHWKISYDESTNEVGFTALPGGYRNAYGCEDMGEYCYFWSTESNTYLRLDFYGAIFLWTAWVDANCIGLSVRCIKD